MAKLKDLQAYLGYEFSSGPYTGSDYKVFQNKYVNYLRSICKERGWELTRVLRNHYCFSAFVKNNENKYVYLSISDVRFFVNEWYNDILVRTAKSDSDYRGGMNNRASLPYLPAMINQLLERA